MPGIGEIPLTWRHDIADGLSTLAVAGSLTAAAGELLYAAVDDVPRRSPAVLINMSALTVTDHDALKIFRKVMQVAVRWPDVLVVVCAPASSVLPLLTADLVDPRLLFDSVAAGRSAISARVPPVTEELLPVADCARRARMVITDACRQWGEPGLIGTATLVASELVTNAAVHARTFITLEIRLQLCHIHIAVFDGSPTAATPRSPTTSTSGGRGLNLVDAVSAAWGSTPLPTGKVVWSALERPPPIAA